MLGIWLLSSLVPNLPHFLLFGLCSRTQTKEQKNVGGLGTRLAKRTKNGGGMGTRLAIAIVVVPH